MADLYVWISGWERFQHYRPERDRCPAWIKDYTKQLDDERYLDLTDRQRALVRDLRDIFAIAHGRMSYDARKIARRRNCHTRDSDLQALNHAGLIEVISRETLEQRLDEFYSDSSPHARPRARREGEEEPETEEETETEEPEGSNRSIPKTAPSVRPLEPHPPPNEDHSVNNKPALEPWQIDAIFADNRRRRQEQEALEQQQGPQPIATTTETELDRVQPDGTDGDI